MKEIAVICAGHRMSPFVKRLVEKQDIVVKFITFDAFDFQIHHADPSKILNYHLEFTNILEARAKKNIESLAIFETLGKFFEFYNPLKLSTLNYLISKYFTSLNPNNKGLAATWKEISKSIFDEEFVFPLYDEIRVLHAKEGEIEYPVRQLVMAREIDAKKENGGKQPPKGKKKTQDEEPEGKPPARSGIIDIDSIEKMKPSQEALEALKNAAGIIIAPTDVISTYILFQCEIFVDALKNAECEIVFISPITFTYEPGQIEQDILLRTEFEPSVVNLGNLIKNEVDTIIIDTKNSDLVGKIRETGTTVLAEDLSFDAQQDDGFLERVFKAASIELETIKKVDKRNTVAIGDRLMGLLSSRFSQNEEEDAGKTDASRADDAKNAGGTTPPPVAPEETGNGQQDATQESPVPIQQGTETSVQKPQAQPASTEGTPSSVKGDGEKHGPEPPKPDSNPGAVQPDVQGMVKKEETPPVKPASPQKPAPAKKDLADQQQPAGQEGVDAKQFDQTIFININKAIIPSYEEGIEVVFSDLLEIQENKELVTQLFDFLSNKLIKLDELDPVKRTIDIITYLAAHNPDVYSDLCADMLQGLLVLDDEALRQKLEAVSLVLQASMVKKEEVILAFIKENSASKDIAVLERVRKILNFFISKDKLFERIICKSLIEVFKETIEEEAEDDFPVESVVFLLHLIDAFTLGQSIIEQVPESLYDKMRKYLGTCMTTSMHAGAVLNILDAFQANEYEALKKALNIKKIPSTIQAAILKRRYITQLAKVGSMSMEIFAQTSGLSITDAEKLIYDMILKGDIPARTEIVGGKLYIVHVASEKKDEKEKKEDGNGASQPQTGSQKDGAEEKKGKVPSPPDRDDTEPPAAG